MAITKVASKKSQSISTKRPKLQQKASDDFESVAKRLECDEDRKTFEAKLGKIAKSPIPKKK